MTEWADRSDILWPSGQFGWLRPVADLTHTTINKRLCWWGRNWLGDCVAVGNLILWHFWSLLFRVFLWSSGRSHYASPCGWSSGHSRWLRSRCRRSGRSCWWRSCVELFGWMRRQNGQIDWMEIVWSPLNQFHINNPTTPQGEKHQNTPTSQQSTNADSRGEETREWD